MYICTSTLLIMHVSVSMHQNTRPQHRNETQQSHRQGELSADLPDRARCGMPDCTVINTAVGSLKSSALRAPADC
jgi:hypothetical protein